MVYLGTPAEPVNRSLLKDADWGGMLLLGASVSMIYAGLDQGNRLDWLGSGTVVALLVGGGLLFPVFVVNEICVREPWAHVNVLFSRNIGLRVGIILLYTLTVLPIVIWFMRDQFKTIPVELEEAAFIDGASVWGAFVRIILPIALPGMVAAFILSLILCWNEYFFAALLTSTNATTLPVMVASQTGSRGVNWWSMAALATAAILPLAIVGIILERYIIKGLTAGSVK
jgi:ABC-type glycerol-3-phosphate transport system permease component